MKSMIGTKITEREWENGMKYARALAYKFASSTGNLQHVDDILTEAYLGLTHALTKFDPEFDPERAAKFTTYARYWIDQHMRRWRQERIKIDQREVISLDQFVGEDADTSLGELGLGETTPFPEEHVLNQQLLQEAWEYLSERDQDVLRRRFWEQQSLDDIGTAHGCSRQRIEQIQIRALKRMRHVLGNRLEGTIVATTSRR